MYKSRKPPPKEVYDRINITEYIKLCRMELSGIMGRPVEMNTLTEAQRVKMLINDPQSILHQGYDFASGIPCRREQKVMCYPSNLGVDKGYVFFFVCLGCNQRKKHLYVYNYVRPPLCRQCCWIPYRNVTYKERKLAFLRSRQGGGANSFINPSAHNVIDHNEAKN